MDSLDKPVINHIASFSVIARLLLRLVSKYCRQAVSNIDLMKVDIAGSLDELVSRYTIDFMKNINLRIPRLYLSAIRCKKLDVIRWLRDGAKPVKWHGAICKMATQRNDIFALKTINQLGYRLSFSDTLVLFGEDKINDNISLYLLEWIRRDLKQPNSQLKDYYTPDLSLTEYGTAMTFDYID
jgi:hypothetical protein